MTDATAFALRFLLFAAVAALVGMGGGIWMGIAHDFTLAPAHAHLNLIGWVTMALYGLAYAVLPRAADGRLPRVQFWLAAGGVLVMIPSLALMMLGHAAALPGAVLGSLLVFAGMACFAAVMARTLLAGRRKAAARLAFL